MFNESFTFHHGIFKAENRLPFQHHNEKVTPSMELKKIPWLAKPC